ncbi:MAG TPA: 4Fe-4S cluster-binding domain-containing protein [Firmicutes bacterium]|nr:4Fe-4S cluster-binding domain-containing protein [Bacillota bacterium]
MKEYLIYRALAHTGELSVRKEKAWKESEYCALCAHLCGVNRLRGEKGVRQAGDNVQISGYGPHYSEEDVLVGTGGSGTIFFTGCNLQCVFCQNWDISQLREGETFSTQRLGEIMLCLEERGCHNINLVSPSHYLPQFLSAQNNLAHDHFSRKRSFSTSCR